MRRIHIPLMASRHICLELPDDAFDTKQSISQHVEIPLVFGYYLQDLVCHSHNTLQEIDKETLETIDLFTLFTL